MTSPLDDEFNILIREQAVSVCQRVEMTVDDAFQLLHRQRYTGPSVLHFQDGRPALLQIPNPLTVRLI